MALLPRHALGERVVELLEREALPAVGALAEAGLDVQARAVREAQAGLVRRRAHRDLERRLDELPHAAAAGIGRLGVDNHVEYADAGADGGVVGEVLPRAVALVHGGVHAGALLANGRGLAVPAAALAGAGLAREVRAEGGLLALDEDGVLEAVGGRDEEVHLAERHVVQAGPRGHGEVGGVAREDEHVERRVDHVHAAQRHRCLVLVGARGAHDARVAAILAVGHGALDHGHGGLAREREAHRDGRAALDAEVAVGVTCHDVDRRGRARLDAARVAAVVGLERAHAEADGRGGALARVGRAGHDERARHGVAHRDAEVHDADRVLAAERGPEARVVGGVLVVGYRRGVRLLRGDGVLEEAREARAVIAVHVARLAAVHVARLHAEAQDGARDHGEVGALHPLGSLAPGGHRAPVGRGAAARGRGEVPVDGGGADELAHGGVHLGGQHRGAEGRALDLRPRAALALQLAAHVAHVQLGGAVAHGLEGEGVLAVGQVFDSPAHELGGEVGLGCGELELEAALVVAAHLRAVLALCRGGEVAELHRGGVDEAAAGGGGVLGGRHGVHVDVEGRALQLEVVGRGDEADGVEADGVHLEVAAVEALAQRLERQLAHDVLGLLAHGADGHGDHVARVVGHELVLVLVDALDLEPRCDVLERLLVALARAHVRVGQVERTGAHPYVVVLLALDGEALEVDLHVQQAHLLFLVLRARDLEPRPLGVVAAHHHLLAALHHHLLAGRVVGHEGDLGGRARAVLRHGDGQALAVLLDGGGGVAVLVCRVDEEDVGLARAAAAHAGALGEAAARRGLCGLDRDGEGRGLDGLERAAAVLDLDREVEVAAHGGLVLRAVGAVVVVHDLGLELGALAAGAARDERDGHVGAAALLEVAVQVVGLQRQHTGQAGGRALEAAGFGRGDAAAAVHGAGEDAQQVGRTRDVGAVEGDVHRDGLVGVGLLVPALELRERVVEVVPRTTQTYFYGGFRE